MTPYSKKPPYFSGCMRLFEQKLMILDQNLQPWKHSESHKQFQNLSKLFKYWFTLLHFAMDDPVVETTPKTHFLA